MKTSNHMMCGTLADPSRVRSPSINVKLSRLAAGRHEWVLTFAGDVDTHVFDAVLQLIERIASVVCGSWHLEMRAAGLSADDEQRVSAGLCALLRLDVQHELVLIPRRARAFASRVLH